MGQAYTPALEVSARKKIRKVRELPLPGRALVKVGDRVEVDTPVLAAELPGTIDIIRVADRLGLEPERALAGLKVKIGDRVEQKALLCEVKSFFGLFTSSVHSPSAGTVEFLTESNAHLGIRHPPIPFSVEAYIQGTIVEVEEKKSVTIETEGAMIQGIFGVGGERFGIVHVLNVPPDQEVGPAALTAAGELRGKILIGGRSFTNQALQDAARAGAVAVITGSIDAQTLRQFVGHEIGVSITGDENVPLSLIVTEGFGALPISERIVALAKTLEGKRGSLSGATQVRAGALRPELIVPNLDAAVDVAHESENILDVGRKVRVIRVPYFGSFGTVSELPHSPEKVESGAVVRVARLKLDDGRAVTVPRANVELVS